MTLTLTAPATLAGTIAGSGALALSGDTVGFGAATLTIANLIVTDDAVVTFDDSLSYAGSLDEAAGTIYIGADDALTLSGSSTLSGSLAGDELIIAGGSTTMTASASISVGAITIDKGADFVATGPSGSDESLASAVANSGTLVVESSASDGSGADLTIFGKLMQASTGIVELLRGATLTLDQVVSGGTIAFGGGADEVLEIDDAASLAATTGALGAEIAGFGVGDTIDFGGLDIASLTASAASGVTTVTLALSGAQSLKFELAGTYAATNFKTTGDAVTLAPNFTTPVLAGAGNTATFVAGSSAGVAVDPLLTISPIGDEITGATVTISQGLNAGDLLGYADMDGIAGVYDAADGVLTLSGTANVVSYEAALESVTYASTSNDPTRAGADAARTITWSVASQTHQSGPTTSTVDITVPAPTLTVSSLYGSYTQGGAAYTPNDVTYVTYKSSADLTGAKVAITGGFFTGDTLGFVSQFGIAGAYDALTGVLTLSGSASVADYQTALELVTFSSTSANPTDYGADESRAFSWQVTGGGKTSTAATSTIGVIGVDQAPTLSGGGNSVQAFAGGAAVAVDPGLTVADADNLTLASATVSISSGFAAGDALNFGASPRGPHGGLRPDERRAHTDRFGDRERLPVDTQVGDVFNLRRHAGRADHFLYGRRRNQGVGACLEHADAGAVAAGVHGGRDFGHRDFRAGQRPGRARRHARPRRRRRRGPHKRQGLDLRRLCRRRYAQPLGRRRRDRELQRQDGRADADRRRNRGDLSVAAGSDHVPQPRAELFRLGADDLLAGLQQRGNRVLRAGIRWSRPPRSPCPPSRACNGRPPAAAPGIRPRNGRQPWFPIRTGSRRRWAPRRARRPTS